MFFTLFDSRALNTKAGVLLPQLKDPTKDTPPADPYQEDEGVIIILILDEAGAARNTVESVVILILKMPKSSATRLKISVIWLGDKAAGWAAIGPAQLKGVPVT